MEKAIRKWLRLQTSGVVRKSCAHGAQMVCLQSFLRNYSLFLFIRVCCCEDLNNGGGGSSALGACFIGDLALDGLRIKWCEQVQCGELIRDLKQT